MLKKNKALILIVISMLLVSMFAFVGCAKKGTVGKEYDSAGLPLTKSAALKLWQGEWGVEDEYGNVFGTLINTIDGKEYQILASIKDLKNNKNLDWLKNIKTEATVSYDSTSKILKFVRTYDHLTYTNTFRFVSKTICIHKQSDESRHELIFKTK